MSGGCRPKRMLAMYGSDGCTRAASCCNSGVSSDAFEVENDPVGILEDDELMRQRAVRFENEPRVLLRRPHARAT